ncbi:Cof-type HAD-IIB family hydrolase [Vallitalea okinawensis]|uniref:Cof-type HAD-IIB family hydrolase n=1 Tax=Vallitalea okinawensis TaxID=2078660 RepID=UPI000CFD5BB9|nr:Cof-type HAD-IIB family hydrolase [Vallitalea okinawensis]
MNNLYISDLDGTLLSTDATLTEFSKSNLIRLIKNEVNFTVASARSVVSIQTIFQGVLLKLPVIEFNGAFISDLKTGRHEIINDIDRDYSEDIFSMITQYGLECYISTFDGTEDHLHYNKITNGGMQWYLNSRLKAKDKRLRKSNLRETLAERVICYTIIDKYEILSYLQKNIHRKFSDHVELHLIENQYSPGWYWLTIHDRKATKDQAIKSLVNNYGLGKSELTVFGDNLNDIKMFKLAKNRIAVGNAKPELKEYATHVIETNKEDSVVRYILEREGA